MAQETGHRLALAPIALMLSAFVLITLGVAFLYPFPSPYDELQHYSVIRAQFEAPTIFPDYSEYKVLRADDLDRWSPDGNYINHPSLYYIALANIFRFSADVIVFRLANVALIAGALALVVLAGARLFRTPAERLLFALIALCFPKYALIGGMINNDNLAMLAGALVFAGLVRYPAAAWCCALGLALAGWSKLTALIALAAVVGIDRLAGVRRAGEAIGSRCHAALAGAALVGALPYLVNLVRTGDLVAVNAAVYGVPVDQRPILGFWRFIEAFFAALVVKWPVNEGGLPLVVAGVTLMVPLVLAAIGAARCPRIRRLAAAYGGSVAIMLAVHVGFGWEAFRGIGDLTIAQTRYYNVLWPGIAVATTAGVLSVTRRRRWLQWPLIGLFLLPTVPGALAVSLVQGAGG